MGDKSGIHHAIKRRRITIDAPLFLIFYALFALDAMLSPRHFVTC